MKQIVIISGKGGTGKTVFTGALAALVENKVMVDCDVDAADLHLLLDPHIVEKNQFKSGVTALVDEQKCIRCGKCLEVCRFEAVQDVFAIDPISCEGYGVCVRACPHDAFVFEPAINGQWYRSRTRHGPMVHARLGIAEENSGKLVTLVRSQAKKIAEEQQLDLVIIDGSPGIGCPVIASVSGADRVLIVTEPTVSGVHDMQRVLALTRHFGIPALIVINKADLNVEQAERIETIARERGSRVIARIPFDRNVNDALIAAKTVIEYGKGPAFEAMRHIWHILKKEL